MRYGAFGLPLFVAAVLCGPAVGADPENSEKTIRAGKLTGILKGYSESDKSLRVEVVYTTTKLNTGALNNMNRAKLDLARATARRDTRGILRAQQSLARAQRDLYKVEQKKQEVTLKMTDDVTFRMMNPPQVFDDKGNLKKLTREELRELKGPNPRMPGYKAEFENLTENQVVQVHLEKKRGRPAVRGKKDPDALLEVFAQYEPKAGMVVILR